jgi:hypothetical protein
MMVIVYLRSDDSVEDIAYLSWDNCYWVYFFYIFESQNRTGGMLRISMRGWLSAVLSALNISVNEYSWQVFMHMHVYDVFNRRDWR